MNKMYYSFCCVTMDQSQLVLLYFRALFENVAVELAVGLLSPGS